MGNKKISWLGVIFLIYLCMFAACSPVDHKGFPSVSLQEVDLGDKHKPNHQHGTGNAKVNHNARRSIVQSSKYAHASGAHGMGAHAGGGSSGNGEHGNNGGSGSPYVQGSTTVIPIYAGGAASNRHPNTHHSAGSHNQNSVPFITLILTALTCFIPLYCG